MATTPPPGMDIVERLLKRANWKPVESNTGVPIVVEVSWEAPLQSLLREAAAEITRLRRAAPEWEDARDAARWRALMSSQRVRVMGSAGFKNVDGAWVPARDDLHIGVEFWNVHPAAHPSAEFPQDKCRAQFVAYVDSLIPPPLPEGEQGT